MSSSLVSGSMASGSMASGSLASGSMASGSLAQDVRLITIPNPITQFLNVFAIGIMPPLRSDG